MSPSVFITRRDTAKSGARYVVRYRLGGRETHPVHAGSFKTMREARMRRDLIAGEIAAGRNPTTVLHAITKPVDRPTLLEWRTRFLASRIDAAPSTLRTYGFALTAAASILGDDRDVDTLTVTEVRELVAALATTLQPSTVRTYMRVIRMLLDFAGLDPNPARDRTVKLPREQTDEISPPTSPHLLAILDRLDPDTNRLLVTLEQTGMRIGETLALTWADVDLDGARFRLRARTTKMGRARWVQVPAWLIAAIGDTCAPEDRLPARRVFPNVTVTAVGSRMARACRDAGIPVYSPHDLRHRRASLWHGQGVSNRELQERIGHADIKTTLGTYGHVMPLDEVPAERLARTLARPR